MPLTPSQSALDALLHSAAWAPQPELGLVRVTGSDRVRWLNGMVTNSIQALQPGEGCYNFVLSVQGRIQADCTTFAQTDSILLQTGRDRIPALMALLDRFIIMDDVELATLELEGLLIAGPEAASVLTGLSLTPPAPLTLQGSDVMLLHAHSPLIRRYELWSTPEAIADLIESLGTTRQASPEALTQLRLLEGTPLYGTDIRDKELPQETAQTRALHFSKGCYLGQEIVERIRSRGNVHRTLAGFLLTGPVPDGGAVLYAEDKPVGELTSADEIPLSTGPITLALGYIRREALDKHLALSYPGGTATPVPLPFHSAAEATENNPKKALLHV